MFTSELIKNAWKIRRAKAEKSGCRLMIVSWKICLKEAKANQTPLDKMQDYYRSLLKKYPNRGLCYLEFMTTDVNHFMANVFHELCRTKDNTDKVTEVRNDDSRYRMRKVK